jgi:hypothetical protein
MKSGPRHGAGGTKEKALLSIADYRSAISAAFAYDRLSPLRQGE